MKKIGWFFIEKKDGLDLWPSQKTKVYWDKRDKSLGVFIISRYYLLGKGTSKVIGRSVSSSFVKFLTFENLNRFKRARSGSRSLSLESLESQRSSGNHLRCIQR